MKEKKPHTPPHGLVICDITAREQADVSSEFAERFVSKEALDAASDAMPKQQANKGVEPWQNVFELSPGSVRLSRFSKTTSVKSENYKPKQNIVEWSDKSRARMTAALCSLDYRPLFEHADRLPALITLTYPGDWLTVVPDAATAKKHLHALRKRYERKFGVPLVAIWRQEYQRRSAPHFHIFCAPPTGQKFREWLSQAWAEIVAHPDPNEFEKHLKAGTGVDYEKGLRSYDPKRVAIYFAKHNSPNKGSKEYQNKPPKEWVEAGSVGRFWGYWGLKPLIVKTEISNEDAVFIARVLRRWSRSSRRYTKRQVFRVNSRTGEVYTRNANRRSKSRMSNRLGFVSVNDGSAMGTTLARAVATCRR